MTKMKIDPSQKYQHLLLVKWEQQFHQFYEGPTAEC
jgi:hypothetical protein